MEKNEHQCVQVENIIILQQKTEGFERHQDRQNGSIFRVEKKLDGLIDKVDSKLDPVTAEMQEISNRLSGVEGYKKGKAESEQISIGKFRIQQDRVAIYIAGAAGLFTLLNLLAQWLPVLLKW